MHLGAPPLAPGYFLACPRKGTKRRAPLKIFWRLVPRPPVNFRKLGPQGKETFIFVPQTFENFSPSVLVSCLKFSRGVRLVLHLVPLVGFIIYKKARGCSNNPLYQFAVHSQGRCQRGTQTTGFLFSGAQNVRKPHQSKPSQLRDRPPPPKESQ